MIIAIPIKMNSRTPFALLAILVVVSAVTFSSAYAGDPEYRGLPDACVACDAADSITAAEKRLLEHIPISVWTDKEEYLHDDMIVLTGYVPYPYATEVNSHVTVMVKNPLGSIVTVGQLTLDNDREFGTFLSTAGKLWQYEGIYTIYVQHGMNSNKIQVDLSHESTSIMTPPSESVDMCADDELAIVGQCVPYAIDGGTVTDVQVDLKDNAIVIMIAATDEGSLTLTPSKRVISDPFMVLVDNEESDDSMIDEESMTIKVMFGPESEMIEIFGSRVIPEFGTIAVMILAAAIVSVIAVSARSRLGIVMPRL